MKKPLSFASRADACTFYGISGPTLRSWVSKGKSLSDPFPEHDPVAVVAWYRRHHTVGTPRSLLTAAAEWEKGGKREKMLASLHVVPAPSEEDMEALDAGGMLEAVDRARRIEALFGKRLEEALKGKGKAAEVELARLPHLKALQALREVETAAVNIARKRGELIERNAVVAAWTNLHAHMPRAISRAFIAAAPEGIPEDQWGEIVNGAVQAAFELLPEILPEILAGGGGDEAVAGAA